MSQIYKRMTSSSPIPPIIPTSFVSDDGTAVPALNILNVLGRDTNTNNDNGIRTNADPDGSDDLYVELTNRNTGTVSTSDATPTTILSVPLAAGSGTYIAEGNLIAYNTTDSISAAYTFVGAARSTAGVATEIAIENKDIWEEVSMEDCDFTVTVSGNSLVVTVVGLVGKTINWNAFFTYRYVG